MSAARTRRARGVLPAPVVAPAGLLQQRDLLDLDAALEPLDHVVDRQRRHRAGRHRLHLDARSGRRACASRDELDDALLDVHAGDDVDERHRHRWASGISSSVRLAAWMPASRATPSTSPFGPCPLSTARAVALRHPQPCPGARDPLAAVLAADVDHPRPSLLVEMRQAPLAHALAPEPRGRAPGAGSPGAGPPAAVALVHLPLPDRRLGLDPVDHLARAGEGFARDARPRRRRSRSARPARRSRHGARPPPRTSP